MTRISEIWEYIRRLKNEVASGRPPVPEQTIGETYDQGEAWLRTVLAEADCNSETDVDTLTEISNENGQVTILNVVQMDRDALFQAAVLAGIAPPTAAPEVVIEVMRLRIVHAAGFTNGLALGLLLGRSDAG